ncbi:hypothetical protein F5X97DRAFT_318579 [Nemania serpens]|nr:hypothetical protein F5X97DRAFT_318579 [Nemania serpens]
MHQVFSLAKATALLAAFNVLAAPIVPGADVEPRDPNKVDTLIAIDGYRFPSEEKRSPNKVDTLISVDGYRFPSQE